MLKVLIVDDNIVRRDKLVAQLADKTEMSFIELEVCISADCARELCKHRRFDILVLDVCLPKKDDGTATAQDGIKLLKDLHLKTNKYLTPTKVIGITADTNFLEKYRTEFMKYTYIVYPAKSNEKEWMSNTIDNILRIVNTSVIENTQKNDTIVISLHGIRTYGHWQNNFSDIIKKNTSNINYYPFKYGFFGMIFFFLPFVRDFKSNRLISSINPILEENQDKKIYIFAHSYGTYVITKLIQKSTLNKKIYMVVFAGSVLPTTYNINQYLGNKVDNIINDCGINDLVLIINKIFVPFLGDAGRKGFEGVNNNKICNRYFRGGHSLYFNTTKNKKPFIEEYWMPYILDNREIEIVDERRESSILSDITEPILLVVSFAMPFVYIYGIYLLL